MEAEAAADDSVEGCADDEEEEEDDAADGARGRAGPFVETGGIADLGADAERGACCCCC